MFSIITVTVPFLLLFLSKDLVTNSQIARNRDEVVRHGRDTSGGTIMEVKPKLVHRLKEIGMKQQYYARQKYTQRKELMRKRLNKITKSKKLQKKEPKVERTSF